MRAGRFGCRAAADERRSPPGLPVPDIGSHATAVVGKCPRQHEGRAGNRVSQETPFSPISGPGALRAVVRRAFGSETPLVPVSDGSIGRSRRAPVDPFRTSRCPPSGPCLLRQAGSCARHPDARAIDKAGVSNAVRPGGYPAPENRTTLRSSGISRRRVPEGRARAKRSWPLGRRPRFASENGSGI